MRTPPLRGRAQRLARRAQVATVALFLLPLGGVLANALEQMREHAREHTVRARGSD